MKINKDKYMIECDCHTGYHSLFFEFYEWNGPAVFKRREMVLSATIYHGSIWQRIKTGLKLIFKKTYDENVDFVFVLGDEKSKMEMRKFAYWLLDICERPEDIKDFNSILRELDKEKELEMNSDDTASWD